jgi:hypothetical protein
MVELLVQAGGDINDANWEGLTPWDLARRLGVRSDEIGRARHVHTRPWPLLNTDPLHLGTQRRSRVRDELVALIESLGGMPGQGRPPRANSHSP